MLNLPLYKAYIVDEVDGIVSVSLVNSPATEYTMQLFKSEKIDYTIEDTDQHIIKTVLMLCETPIYRNSYGYEYYVAYDKETLSYMAQKMLRNNFHNQYEIEHNGDTLPKGCIELVEIFQKDIANGINPKGFETVSDGSLLATYKVNDEELWQMCKDGTFNGVSLSGLFYLDEEQFSKVQKKKNYTMTLNNLKSLIKDILLNYNSQESNIGNLFYSGDEIQVGTTLTDKDGNTVQDGEIKIDGYILQVENGIVKEMTPENTEETPQEETVETPVTEEVKEDEPEEIKPEEEKEPETEETEDTPTESIEEETPTEETPEDVTPLVDEPQPNADIEGLKAEVDALKNAIAELLTKINQPVEKPIIEEFSAVSEKSNKDNFYSKLDRIGSYLNKNKV